jgi:hypothetical protein
MNILVPGLIWREMEFRRLTPELAGVINCGSPGRDITRCLTDRPKQSRQPAESSAALVSSAHHAIKHFLKTNHPIRWQEFSFANKIQGEAGILNT